jgi:hypothetical protein
MAKCDEEQLNCSSLGGNGGFFWQLWPNCDSGSFEVVLDVTKLQDLVIAVCGKTPSLTHKSFIDKLYVDSGHVLVSGSVISRL